MQVFWDVLIVIGVINLLISLRLLNWWVRVGRKTLR